MYTPYDLLTGIDSVSLENQTITNGEMLSMEQTMKEILEKAVQ